MVVTLSFSDPAETQVFELSIDEKATLEELKKLVAAKAKAHSVLVLKTWAGADVKGVGSETLASLGITNGQKFSFVTSDDPDLDESMRLLSSKVAKPAEEGDAEWDEFEEDEAVGLTVVDAPAAADAPPGLPGLMRQKSWVVLDKAQLSEKQQDQIEEMSAILNLSSSKATQLLRAYKWNQEVLLKEYIANPEKVLESVGLASDALDEKVIPVKGDESVDCPFCGETKPMSETHALDCGHRYCYGCWTNWFDAEFQKGAECIFTTCPAYKCKELVPVEFFQKHISKDQREKLEDWLNTLYIRFNAFVKWCPRAGCGRAVEYKKSANMKTVQCECGFKFCFGCGNEAHEPAPCKSVLKWLKQDNSLILWLRENRAMKEGVKACPNCHELIEKNQGCKHMTCRNCRYEFCWLCYQVWGGHQESLCNDYDRKDKEQEEKEMLGDSGAGGVRRYQFYFSRFENHQKAIQFAERMRADTEKKMVKMQEVEGSSLSAVLFLSEAVDTVVTCRQMLKWSYAWAFDMPEEGAVRAQLKMHQDLLEEFTEELHGFVEQPLSKLLSPKIKTSIINLNRVIQKYKQNIIDFARANH